MKAKTFWITLLAAVLWTGFAPGVSTGAADIAGVWQGTLHAKTPLRIVLKIGRDDNGALTASLYSIDQSPDPIPASSITLQGSALTAVVAGVHGSYVGTLSADGNSVAGTWMQGRSFPLNLQRATTATAWPTDPAVKHTQFVTVEPDVKLEVLDWGGTGRPVILLAGQGNSAHVFSDFAKKLSANYHVYGITRRGYGDSSKPPPTAANYNADRLGDDVIAVIEALHVERPVLIGHSIAGEELSSVGTRYPQKIAGLVYLDAGYSYAVYSAGSGDMERYSFDVADLEHDLASSEADDPATASAAMGRLVRTELPRIERDLRAQQTFYAAIAMLPGAVPDDPVGDAIDANQRKYAGPIGVPVLAIYAAPHNWQRIQGSNKAADAAADAAELKATQSQIRAFESQVPSAKVIVIPHADHDVFISNQAEVLRDVNAFITGLPLAK